MADVEKLVPKFDLQEVIAFLLPGIPLVRAVAYVSPSVDKLWQGFITGEGKAGLYVAAVLIALTGGLLLSTIRATIEARVLRIPRLRESLSIDYTQLNKDNQDRYYEAVRQVYRYAQFAGNMALALPALSLARWWAVGCWDVRMSLLAVASLVLIYSAVMSFLNCRRVMQSILRPPPRTVVP